ncbi:MAG: TIGR04086 family membrane protein [Christensenellaceae bacterium]|jgi:putative membrane protein (TIGR04086 family)|nr:TIGR04086 family membrane protein [Christensenellaceae bacterium]
MKTILGVFKGLLFAICLTLLLVLALTIIGLISNVSNGVLQICVWGIKVISVLFAVFVALKSDTKLAFAWGGLVGILFALFAYLSFSAINGDFAFKTSNLIDLVSLTGVGIFGGFLARAFKRD